MTTAENTTPKAAVRGLAAHSSDAPPLTWLYRYGVLRTLAKFRRGTLLLSLPRGEATTFGASGASPAATMRIHRDDFYAKCALHGGVGLGESYVDGDWDTDDLRGVIEWFIVNIQAEKALRRSSQNLPAVGVLKLADRLGHLLRSNSRDNSRRNIEEHYDLGNEFYKLWLDPTMTYSSAKFTSAAQTLEEAQLAKYQALAEKLDLRPGDHVLEIGCGWGGFSCYAAERFGCRVTGVTISRSQFEEATRRVRSAGLGERVEIRLEDYRDISGTYDKIASIEMLEAVGHRYLKTFFAKCHGLLSPDGLMALQMITVPDNEHRDLRRGTDFIQKHIFPGSLLLSVGAVNDAINATGDLTMHGLEDLGASYARTLREWHARFNEELDGCRKLGFSDAFVRKWNFYLKYCEAAFATRNISVVQVVYTRPGNANLHHEDGTSSGKRP